MKLVEIRDRELWPRRQYVVPRWLLWAIILAGAVLAMTACDPVVESRPVGPAVTRTRSEGCSHLGFCFTCLPGFNGKMECGFKMSAFCPGTHSVTYAETPTREVHKSGDVTDGVIRQFITEGPCT
jgi:hypothetical protein